MEKYIDLHVHTNCSDGSFTPREAVQHAGKVGLAAISITDHDILDGIPDAIDEGKKTGVEIVPGIELSTELSIPERSEMHILGYFVNWENTQLQESLAIIRKARQERARKIIEKLHSLKVDLDENRLYRIAGTTGSIGRLHFAKALIEQGVVRSIGEAFQRYLGIGRSAYVPKLRLSPEEAIRMILKTGGVPVLAHPFYGHYSNKNIIKALVRDGLMGIEVWHSKHPPETVQLFQKLAKEFGLLMTGGSDCHGAFEDDPIAMGTIKVPYEALEELRRCKAGLDDKNRRIFEEGNPS